MKLITKEWLDRAKDDLDAIEELLKRKHLTNIVAFHAQQAVEKTLKAVIEELGIGLRKTHNLLRLDELIKSRYPIIHDLEMLERLDSVYTESRYPDDVGLLPYGKPTQEDAAAFYQFAQEIYARTWSLLTHPAEERTECGESVQVPSASESSETHSRC